MRFPEAANILNTLEYIPIRWNSANQAENDSVQMVRHSNEILSKNGNNYLIITGSMRWSPRY